jgi:hypothetical protein
VIFGQAVAAVILAITVPAHSSGAVTDIYLKCMSRQTLQATRSDGSMPPARVGSNVSEYLLWIGNGRLSVMSTEVMTSWSQNFTTSCPGALIISDGSIAYQGSNRNCGVAGPAGADGPFFGVGGYLSINRITGRFDAGKKTQFLSNGSTIETTFSGQCEKIDDPLLNRAF